MLEALLFDLDGTLVHTDPVHMRAWRAELAEHGLEIDEPFYRSRISGNLNPDIVDDLLPGLSETEAYELIDRKEAAFRKLAGSLERLAGLDALLAWADRVGLALALVTNAPRENAAFMLEALGLSEKFPTIVLGHEAPAGKPHPAPYQMALEALGIGPEAGIAFEDSVSGVTSAHRAGLQVVGIETTHSGSELKAAGAETTVADFEDEDLWRLLRKRLGRTG